MKKNFPLKAFFVIILSFFSLILLACATFLLITAGVGIDNDKLVKVEGGFEFYDSAGTLLSERVGGNSVTSCEKIPDHVKNAFVAIEDKRFYKHGGVDFKALFRAAANNARSLSLKEGGSTITQQLIKNTHLSGEKTFKRKLSEMRLAVELEKRYDKNEILEKYLNTIYFGSGAYGITDASRIYFDKKPEDLSVNEAAVLAATIKAPALYSPFISKEKCEKRKNLVLSEMFSQGYIEKNEYDESTASFPKLCLHGDAKGEYDYLYLASKEASASFGSGEYYGGRKKIYTAFEKDKQEAIESALKKDSSPCEKSAIMINSEGYIVAYYSTVAEAKGQAGSALKPIAVYAPAIETGAVTEATPILDEKTDFNGYSPSNYNDMYYGYVSVKESLAKSLNACAVKILNYVGVENSKKYLEKTGIKLSDGDDSLCLALGCTEKGIDFKNLVAAYGVFLSGGSYNPPSFIVNNFKKSKKRSDAFCKQEVFSRGTCDVMNEMLSYTVKNGTAKKLSFLNFPIYAKTGTVGNKEGNTDAYCISYTSEYVLGIRYGNTQENLMQNRITGGTYPTERAAEIWEKVYRTRKPKEIEKSDESVILRLDKISYDTDKVLEIADKNAPERFVFEGLFTKNNVPLINSERFSSPKLESGNLSVVNKGICIRLCLTYLYDAVVYRADGKNKRAIFDVKGSLNEISLLDEDVSEGKTYEYFVMPYYENDKECFYGKEVYLGKIKTPQTNGVGEWWKDDFE